MRELQQIACVDDDPHILMILEAVLSSGAGFDVTTYASGQEALDGMAADTPQMLLLDVCMPLMDGLETARRLRATSFGQTLPVAFITGRTEPRDLALYRREGVQGLIAKPFDMVVLLSQIDAIWRKCQQSALA